jgi:hypothetical protein
MPIAVQCPSCKRKLNAPDKLLGKRVKCPGCGNAFAVKPPEEEFVDAEPIVEPEPQDEAVQEKPRLRRSRDDDGGRYEEDRGRARRRNRDDEEEDEDEEAAPRRRRRRQPHRGGLLLGLGISTLVLWCCPLAGLIMAVIVANLAKKDLAEMAAGRMDKSGRGMTMAGNICAIVGAVLALLNMLAYVIMRAMVCKCGRERPAPG